MNSKTFSTLHVDVLFYIYGFLSPKDVISVGRTCRYLWDSIGQRSIWIQKYSNLPTQFPSSSISSFSTDDIRRNVIRYTTVDELWLHPSGEFHPPVEEILRLDEKLDRLSLFPGGEYLVIFYDNGWPWEVRSFADPDQVWRFESIDFHCPLHPVFHRRVRFHKLLPTSETSGHMVTGHCSKENKMHVQIYSYSIGSFGIDFARAANIVFDNCKMDYQPVWGKSGQKFFTLFDKPGDENGKCYLACFELPFHNQVRCVFELLELTNDPWYISYCLVVISSRRILVAGEPHGFVIYDLPDIPVPRTEHSIPVQPIWRYNGDRMKFPYDYYIQSSPVFYEHAGSSTPLVYVLGNGQDLHFFKFSDRNIVEEHRTYDLGSDASISEMMIGYLRGIKMNEETNRIVYDEDGDGITQDVVAHLFPLPPTQIIGELNGPSWLIDFGDHAEIFTRNSSIDDRSGRVALLLEDRTSDVRNILLINSVPMPWD